VTVAAEVGPLELADYQKAVRLVLRHPLITEGHPDRAALPLVRRWADQLRTDLFETFGYRLLTTANTARLMRVQDELDSTRPALTRTGRPFDRRRYAYLVLTLATLGRSGTQIALSELADAVAADATRIDGLGLDTERKTDRDAFVDAVTWLTERGALALADGSATDWASNTGTAEALYDIDREIVFAVYRPSRVLQHMRSVTALLDSAGLIGQQGPVQGVHTVRQAASRRARRLVLERPAVYYADVSESLRGQLRHPGLADDLERLTGLTVERRAEGLAIIDTSGRLSDVRFPGGGTVAQVALLLSVRIATAVQAGQLATLPAATSAERLEALAALIDSALPARGLLDELADAGTGEEPGEREETAPAAYPFLTDAWSRSVMNQLIGQYGKAFGAKQSADPDRLLGEALRLLASLHLIARVEGGVLALPLLARYRGAVAEVKLRPQTTLFDVEDF
jgi:uncharacterized protein (TIGR02678 family)